MKGKTSKLIRIARSGNDFGASFEIACRAYSSRRDHKANEVRTAVQAMPGMSVREYLTGSRPR